MAEAAPVANGMGLPVGVGVTPPVEAMVGEATPEGVLEQAYTVTTLECGQHTDTGFRSHGYSLLGRCDSGHGGDGKSEDVELHFEGGVFVFKNG